MIIVGRSGMGKTSLCANFPGVCFIIDDKERGIEDLKQCGLVDPTTPVWEPITDWNSLFDVCDTFIQSSVQEHGFQTLVFEGITGFEQFCWRHSCHENFDDNWSLFMSYSAGPRLAAKNYWPEFMSKLERIRETGVHVILTGHTHVKPTVNLGGNDYDSETCYCDKETWNATHLCVEAVLMLTLDVSTEIKGMKAKPTNEGLRLIRCDKSPVYDAKNRYGIQVPIQCGSGPRDSYLNFCKAASLDPDTLYFK